ncbi:MAG: urease accessory protein UreD [Pseudomonadota bacterium]|nr:urease accessory protein [Pseudomonadales bacterium]MDY6920047.1 urease accessory protein UreD [Pseudomonadota bacterium]
MNAIAKPLAQGWSATLDLEFAARGGRTVLARNRHQGPLRVQRPFYPETGGQAHVYVLHPPGGIVAGDSLAIDIDVAVGAHGLVTTPSAGRVYRSNAQGLLQTQQVTMTVAEGGFGEWLPQENIVFNGARAWNQTRIQLAPGARFIGWEITCLGRPASAQWFDQGSLCQSWWLERAGKPLLLEKSRFDGGSELLQAAWGLQGHPTLGTMVCTLEDPALESELKALCAGLRSPGLVLEVTQLPQLLVVRAQAPQAAAVNQAFFAVWHRLRKALLGVPAVAPRIWFT